MGAFIRHADVAEMIGISPSTFHKARPALEAEGFPAPDPVLRRYMRADVEAWIQSRRRVRDPDTVDPEGAPVKINWDAL